MLVRRRVEHEVYGGYLEAEEEGVTWTMQETSYEGLPPHITWFRSEGAPPFVRYLFRVELVAETGFGTFLDFR